MALKSGSKLGPYEIVAPLGAGGMGEVYRARDSRLNRDVAIKVLPEALARDSERLLRFEREAKLLASLSHPSIAAVYGFEDHQAMKFLVMEYVEGETLASRIKRGRLPIDVLPDGDFVMVEPADWEKQTPRIHVVLNWREELLKR